MFALGHLGIGKAIAARPYRGFSRAGRYAFLVGALLPDVIDKPLFYIPFWITGKIGALLSGTHLFAHTGLFLLLLIVVALITRAERARAVALGVATHFVLDLVGQSMDLEILVWPAFGWRFPTFRFGSVGEHLETILNPITLAGEIVGAAILLWDYWRARRRVAS